MSTPTATPGGSHTDLIDRVTDWTVEAKDGQPATVSIRAALETGSGRPASVTLNMDGFTALRLYEQLGDEIRRLGWQKHIAGGRPV